MSLTNDQITAKNFKEFYDKILPYLGGGSGSSSMNYSTDEQVIGTWIDGKPLYQKTFTGSTTGGIVENTYYLNVANVETIVNRFGAIYRNDGYQQEFNSYLASTNKTFANLKPTQNNIELYMSVPSDYQAQNYFITLQYTKTTD